MAIDFVCKCGKKYSVGVELAGKVAQCARCKDTLTIPVVIENKSERIQASVEKSPNRWPPGMEKVFEEEKLKEQQEQSTEINFTPSAQQDEKAWYVFNADGNQYGPATKAELDEWVKIGSVTSTCQIYGPGQSMWQPAGAFYPQLGQVAQQMAGDADQAPIVAESALASEGQASTPVQGNDATGTVTEARYKGTDEVADAVIPAEERLLSSMESRETVASAPVKKEFKKIANSILLSDQNYHVGSQLNYRKRLTAASMISATKFKIADQIHVFHFKHPNGEFALIVPFDNEAIAPVEFVAKMEGKLSDSIALVRVENHQLALESNTFQNGTISEAIGSLGKQQSLWIGCDGTVPEIAVEAQNNTRLAKFVNWEGTIKEGQNKKELSIAWGIQAVPLNEENYLLAGQLVPKQKLTGFSFGTVSFADFCNQFDQFIKQREPTTVGQKDYIDPGLWFALANEVLGWR